MRYPIPPLSWEHHSRTICPNTEGYLLLVTLLTIIDRLRCRSKKRRVVAPEATSLSTYPLSPWPPGTCPFGDWVPARWSLSRPGQRPNGSKDLTRARE